MELNEPDLNNLDRIIAHKRHARTPLPAKPSILQHAASVKESVTFISNEGETVVSQIRQPQKHLSKEEVAQIVIDYQGGKSANVLAREYGCDRHTIVTHLKKHGINVSRSKIRSDKDVRKIISMYEAKHFIADIAELYEVSESSINRLLRANGVIIRSRWDYEEAMRKNT